MKYMQQGQQPAIVNQEPPPRTLASAISRYEQVNQRLAGAAERLGILSNQLCVLHGVSQQTQDNAPANGAIDRLNQGADIAHDHLNEIENLLDSIANALG